MQSEENQPRERELLAFNREIDWDREGRLGTVFFGPTKRRSFPPLPPGTIRELADNGYLDLSHQHNDAPPAGTLLEWAEEVQSAFLDYQFEVGLIGYMVSPDRGDSRIAIEGVSIRSPTVIPERLKADVANQFDPDLLTIDDFHVELQWE